MADLTRNEFLELADLYPQQLNIWCTATAPTTVLGISVPFIDQEGNSISNILAQITKINIPVDSENTTSVELIITAREIRTSGVYSYYFFDVVPKDVTILVDNPSENEPLGIEEGILSPNLVTAIFNSSVYNVIINTAQDNRTSEYLTIQGTDSKAPIQDSLYSDTGWINGRYLGSSTNRNSFSSIDSALVGGAFQGTYYPFTAADQEIQNADSSERSYLEYFHNGAETYPSYSIETPSLFYLQNNIDNSVSTFTVIPQLTNKPLKLHQQGDLLRPSGSSEIMKVIGMVNTISNQYDMEVIRGWNNTVKTSVLGSTSLYKINSIRIFELEGNKPSPVKRGKIRVKDTQNILYIDQTGYMVSGTLPT